MKFADALRALKRVPKTIVSPDPSFEAYICPLIDAAYREMEPSPGIGIDEPSTLAQALDILKAVDKPVKISDPRYESWVRPLLHMAYAGTGGFIAALAPRNGQVDLSYPEQRQQHDIKTVMAWNGLSEFRTQMRQLKELDLGLQIEQPAAQVYLVIWGR
jgi:hypothetical protein